MDGEKTITKQLEELAEYVCDHLCKDPGEYKDQDEMWNEICDKCPLVNKL